ncbi:hypothetical protein [Paenibacillus illinoisensis]|uniref:Uncharacterized protein n=1 Tax=Paenibacillus illinoisensis TaxID=59845 RepID=A0A2W0C4I7_9BACL|nr:hypothetical protein [Paenibacillus illinoisensis]PYY27483.1 Uncharacterized protein PIL02S_04076 [Paenibacillus illinoisensis]
MGLFEWIFDNLYIVAVIGFALFSLLGKAAKSADPNKKRPQNGMPTFGGNGDLNRKENSPSQASTQQSSGPANDGRYEDDRYDEDAYDDRYDQQYPEPAYSSDPSSQSFLGGMESSLEKQKIEMEKQQRMIQERLNRFSSAKAPVISDSSWDEASTSESAQSLLRTEDIRSGVLWAEVLGPPRSKQPFGTRGKL